jgi:hypothetical protein
VFPFSAIQFAWGSIGQVFVERETILGLRPDALLASARHQGSGVTRFEKDKALNGLTLLGGFFDDDLGYRLVRMDGTIVARWRARFHEIFPDPSHMIPATRVPQTNWNTGVHGAIALPDGSIVFNFEGMGTAKLDRCGAVVWTVPQMTHHTIERAEGGGFWVPNTRYVSEASRFRELTPPYDENTVVKVSEDGAILEEISVLGLIFENDLESLLFANGMQGVHIPDTEDLLHLNDVEELTSSMAEKFPGLAAGDLLISLRNYNLLMIVDPRTHKVKWHQTGPWLKQHDPDFQPNGRIILFNNNSDGSPAGVIRGGSNILQIDPSTNEVEVIFGTGQTQHFYTEIRGQHQVLQNGNLLITESGAGRAFEVDRAGEVVWEFVNRFDEEWVAMLAIANRYAEDYFTVRDWTCK